MMRKNLHKGFSLIELMVALGIIAILATVAAGFMGENVTAAKRTDGRSALLTSASTLEKCKAIYGTYNNANCDISNGDSFDSPDQKYTVTVTSTATTFSLTATPKATDEKCTSIKLDHLGQQTGTGSDAELCW